MLAFTQYAINVDEEQVKSLINSCKVSQLLGIEIYEVKEGKASGKLPLRDDLLNIFGMPHGGVLFTFADQVCAACGNAMGRKAVAVESTAHYMKAVSGESMLYAKAEVTYTSRSIGRVEASVFTSGGETILKMHQIFFIKNEFHESKIN